MIWVLRFLLLGATFSGAIKSAELAWTMGDIGVGIMAWLNFVAIFLLRKPALALLKDYERQEKQGNPELLFDPDQSECCDLQNMDLWRRVAARNRAENKRAQVCSISALSSASILSSTSS